MSGRSKCRVLQATAISPPKAEPRVYVVPTNLKITLGLVEVQVSQYGTMFTEFTLTTFMCSLLHNGSYLEDFGVTLPCHLMLPWSPCYFVPMHRHTPTIPRCTCLHNFAASCRKQPCLLHLLFDVPRCISRGIHREHPICYWRNAQWYKEMVCLKLVNKYKTPKLSKLNIHKTNTSIR